MRPHRLESESILQIVDPRPPGSATEQVKATFAPGHTGGGDVKLLSVVTAPVQIHGGSDHDVL